MSEKGDEKIVQANASQGESIVVTPNGQEAAELLIYELKPELEGEFFDGGESFYRKVIIPWLQWQSGVTRADAWVVKRLDEKQQVVGLQLMIVSSPNPPPWDPIPDFGKYVRGAVTIHPRPDLNLP